jgi:hypothetical protein
MCEIGLKGMSSVGGAKATTGGLCSTVVRGDLFWQVIRDRAAVQVCRGKLDPPLDRSIVNLDPLLDGLHPVTHVGELTIDDIRKHVGSRYRVGMAISRLATHTFERHLAGHAIDDGLIELMQLLEHAAEKQAIAQYVDPSWNTGGEMMDSLIRFIGQNRVRPPVDELQPVLDIGPGLSGVERT